MSSRTGRFIYVDPCLCCEGPKPLSPGLLFPQEILTQARMRGQDTGVRMTMKPQLSGGWESGTNSSHEAIPRDSVSSEPGKPVPLGRPIKLLLSSSSLDSSFSWLTFLKIQLLTAFIVTKLIDFLKYLFILVHNSLCSQINNRVNFFAE